MLIKSADDKSKDLVILQSFLARPDLTINAKERIDQEIKKINAGLKGEREAAYEMNFHYETSKNWALIHDLRIQCDGRVAQIDHLAINRLMEIWVCESKHFSEGIAINEFGECSTFYAGKEKGVSSPFEQNRKHVSVLESVFKTGLLKLPTRLGFNINPTIHSLILISKSAIIRRPKAKIPEVDTIIKNDQFKAQVDKFRDADNNLLNAAKIVGSDTLEAFAQKIAELHIPINFDWYAKFGLTRIAASRLSVNQPLADYKIDIKNDDPQQNYENTNNKNAVTKKPSIEKLADIASEKKKLICKQCGEVVSYTVAKFCWFNKPKFGGNVFCMDCQKTA